MRIALKIWEINSIRYKLSLAQFDKCVPENIEKMREFVLAVQNGPSAVVRIFDSGIAHDFEFPGDLHERCRSVVVKAEESGRR